VTTSGVVVVVLEVWHDRWLARLWLCMGACPLGGKTGFPRGSIFVAITDRVAHFGAKEAFVVVLDMVSKVDLCSNFGGV
jgi:hypothetical protein